MILLLAIAVSLVAHVLLGWQWSIVGGLVAGLAIRRVGWLLGSFAVLFSWLILIVYNFAVAPQETARFIDITARLFGNMGGALLVLTTVSLGAVLGLLGGVIGSLTRSIIDIVRGTDRRSEKNDIPRPADSSATPPYRTPV